MFIRMATWSDPDTWTVREIDDTVLDALLDRWAAVSDTADAPAPGSGAPAGEVPAGEVPAGGGAASVIPGGAVAAELDLATADPAGLSAGELVDAITGFEQVVAWATARQHELIAEFHARPGDGTVRAAANVPDPAAQSATRREWAADEIGLALTLARVRPRRGWRWPTGWPGCCGPPGTCWPSALSARPGPG